MSMWQKDQMTIAVDKKFRPNPDVQERKACGSCDVPQTQSMQKWQVSRICYWKVPAGPSYERLR